MEQSSLLWVFLGDTASEWMSIRVGLCGFDCRVCLQENAWVQKSPRIAFRMVLVGFSKLIWGWVVIIEVGMMSTVGVCLRWCGSCWLFGSW